ESDSGGARSRSRRADPPGRATERECVPRQIIQQGSDLTLVPRDGNSAIDRQAARDSKRACRHSAHIVAQSIHCLVVPSIYSSRPFTPLSECIRDAAHPRVAPPSPCPRSAAEHSATWACP